MQRAETARYAKKCLLNNGGPEKMAGGSGSEHVNVMNIAPVCRWRSGLAIGYELIGNAPGVWQV